MHRSQTRTTLQRLLVVGALALGMLTLAPGSQAGQIASANPNSLAFGSQHLGTSTFKTITVTLGIGYYVKSLGGTGNGSNASWSATAETACSTPGPGTCQVVQTFSPRSVGPLSATLVIIVCSDSDPNCHEVPVGLTGTGVSPGTVTPTSINFGNVAIGRTLAKPVTVTLDKDWSVAGFSGLNPPFGSANIGANCSLAGAGKCNFNATFSPTDPVAAATTLGISLCWTGHHLCTSLAVKLNGVGTAAATPSPTSIAFGNLHAGKALVKPVKVTVAGNYHIESIAMANTAHQPFDVRDIDGNCSLTGPLTCTFNAVFDPYQVGYVTGTVVLNVCPYTNVHCQTYSVDLNGTGQLPGANANPTVTFPSTKVGQDAPKSTSVTVDPGWHVGSFTIGGAGEGGPFRPGPAGPTCGGTATATASCPIPMLVHPRTIGALSDTLVVRLCPNAGSNPCIDLPTVALKGTGLAPATVSPTSIAFSSVAVYKSKATNFKVTLDPGWSFNGFSGSGTTSPFAVDTVAECTSSVLTCTFAEIFTPQYAAVFTGTTYAEVCQDSSGLCVQLPGLKVTGTGTLTATTTKETASRASVPLGGSIRLVAVITPAPLGGSDLGTITFYDGSTPISGCVNKPVYTDDFGHTGAQCDVSFGSVGKHVTKAVFSGNPGYKTSTSATVTITVTAPLL